MHTHILRNWIDHIYVIIKSDIFLILPFLGVVKTLMMKWV